MVAFIYLFFWLIAFKICCVLKKSINCLFHIALQKGLAVDFNLSKNQKDVVPMYEMSASAKSCFQIVYLTIMLQLKSMTGEKQLRIRGNAALPVDSSPLPWFYCYNHNHCLFLFLSESGEDDDDRTVVAEIMQRCFVPAFVTTIPWEGFHFAGHEIRINEATDCYGAVVWPSV